MHEGNILVVCMLLRISSLIHWVGDCCSALRMHLQAAMSYQNIRTHVALWLSIATSRIRIILGRRCIMQQCQQLVSEVGQEYTLNLTHTCIVSGLPL
jgi:hypothetical protein